MPCLLLPPLLLSSPAFSALTWPAPITDPQQRAPVASCMQHSLEYATYCQCSFLTSCVEQLQCCHHIPLPQVRQGADCKAQVCKPLDNMSTALWRHEHISAWGTAPVAAPLSAYPSNSRQARYPVSEAAAWKPLCCCRPHCFPVGHAGPPSC